MSNTSPILESSENIMEAPTNISKQIAEMNGRMGGMEERLVRVEDEVMPRKVSFQKYHFLGCSIVAPESFFICV